jgi:hypothetical protein
MGVFADRRVREGLFMGDCLDITGMKFGNLTALRFLHKIGYIQIWEVQCTCGHVKPMRKISITNNKALRCRKCYLENPHKPIKHGMSQSSEYRSWQELRYRCLNKKSHAYKDYGGRGITVCSEWINSFENFLRDMGLKPFENASIDRIDNSKGYSKENCRWANQITQCNNTRWNKIISFNGKSQSLATWCRELKLPYHTIKARLKFGWNIEDAFLLGPIRGARNRKTVKENPVDLGNWKGKLI